MQIPFSKSWTKKGFKSGRVLLAFIFRHITQYLYDVTKFAHLTIFCCSSLHQILSSSVRLDRAVSRWSFSGLSGDVSLGWGQISIWDNQEHVILAVFIVVFLEGKPSAQSWVHLIIFSSVSMLHSSFRPHLSSCPSGWKTPPCFYHSQAWAGDDQCLVLKKFKGSDYVFFILSIFYYEAIYTVSELALDSVRVLITPNFSNMRRQNGTTCQGTVSIMHYFYLWQILHKTEYISYWKGIKEFNSTLASFPVTCSCRCLCCMRIIL